MLKVTHQGAALFLAGVNAFEFSVGWMTGGTSGW